ncbi:MAG: enoyl-CoA hydratase-related protein [Bacilli bacterium]
MYSFETIQLEHVDGQQSIVILTLNRPQSLNAMNTKMALELIDVFHQLEDNDTVRAVILTGTGTKSFCVGADLKERNNMTKKDWKKQHAYFEEVTERIRNFPYPVIAAVNGFALGGGFEIALSCDLRIGTENAQVGLPEAKVGLIPGIGGTQLIARAVPTGIAKEMLFTGRRMSVIEASRWGIFNHVYSSDTYLQQTIELVITIVGNAPLPLQALKKVVNKGTETDLSTGLALELEAYYHCANSEDRMEGISAFNEKRAPEWKCS